MKIKKYFTTNHIIEGLGLAILLSAFIYIEHFSLLSGYAQVIFNTITITYGIYRVIIAKIEVWFFIGFFISIFWLWWMSISFIYYNQPYLVPVVIALIGIIFGVLFLTFAYISKNLAKRVERYFLAIYWERSRIVFNAISIVIIEQIEPFGFNWLKIEYGYTNSIFSSETYAFILIVLVLASFALFKKIYILLILTLAISFNSPIELKPSALRDIELVSTDIDVREKWRAENRDKYTNLALLKIDKAIRKGKKLIILPESLLPYFLNIEQSRLKPLLERSKEITIIIGALYYKGKNNFRNSAYIIKNGNYKVANKVVLVPFGEANPLPDFLSSIVNKIFFDGAVDYKADSNYTTINVLNRDIKVAICYEGTAKNTYKDYPKHLILISNDAWFKPSIEHTLQKIIIMYFSKRYGTTIYHSINGSKAYIIMPHSQG